MEGGPSCVYCICLSMSHLIWIWYVIDFKFDGFNVLFAHLFFLDFFFLPNPNHFLISWILAKECFISFLSVYKKLVVIFWYRNTLWQMYLFLLCLINGNLGWNISYFDALIKLWCQIVTLVFFYHCLCVFGFAMTKVDFGWVGFD